MRCCSFSRKYPWDDEFYFWYYLARTAVFRFDWALLYCFNVNRHKKVFAKQITNVSHVQCIHGVSNKNLITPFRVPKRRRNGRRDLIKSNVRLTNQFWHLPHTTTQTWHVSHVLSRRKTTKRVTCEKIELNSKKRVPKEWLPRVSYIIWVYAMKYDVG